MQAYFRLAQAVEAKQRRPQKQWRYLHCVEPDEAVRVEFKTATLRGQRRAGALRLHRRHAAGREKPTDSLRIHLVEHRLLRRQARPPLPPRKSYRPRRLEGANAAFRTKEKKILGPPVEPSWSAGRTNACRSKARMMPIGPPVVRVRPIFAFRLVRESYPF